MSLRRIIQVFPGITGKPHIKCHESTSITSELLLDKWWKKSRAICGRKTKMADELQKVSQGETTTSFSMSQVDRSVRICAWQVWVCDILQELTEDVRVEQRTDFEMGQTQTSHHSTDPRQWKHQPFISEHPNTISIIIIFPIACRTWITWSHEAAQSLPPLEASLELGTRVEALIDSTRVGHREPAMSAARWS